LKVDTEVPTSKKSEKGAGFNASPGYECPNCHAPAARDKAFCPSCGESMKKATSSADDDVVDVEPNGN